MEIRTHRPNQPKENLVVKHLFPPVNNNISQSIASIVLCISCISETHDATLAGTYYICSDETLNLDTTK